MKVSEGQAKLQFTLQKIAIAWSFCMVVTSFNRVAIIEMGLPAAIISVLIGVYTLFGPLQPVIGRMCERWPIFGYRRTPYMLLGTLLGGCAFPLMPAVLVDMQAGSTLAYVYCLLLFCAFGLCIAMQANVFLDLLNDVTTKESRSRVVTLTWTVQALAMAGWAWVFGLLMPEYSLEAMQDLYNLTPFVMLSITFLGLFKLETPLNAEQLQTLKNNPPKPVKLLDPMKESMAVLGYNRHAFLFFVFIIFSLLSVFLQDMLQELWADDLFGLAAGESTIYQRFYNGIQTLGMAACGIFVGVTAKKRIAAKQAAGESTENEKTLPFDFGKRLMVVGALLSIMGFALLAWASWLQNLTLFNAFYCFSAFSLGLLVFPSISFMADMTVEGQESKYLGLWSLAQVIGLFLSFTVSGVLYTLLVESAWFSANVAFALIFILQALMVVMSYLVVRNVTIEGLQNAAQPEQDILNSIQAQT
ncbi:BCD family MFS transporter [Aestuariicella hydrocarbonica]|uniref:BCD family MFS transporter n=1 Tax=Pseudomaricurvus hydrocarbonicus TaxID=1470433 RepID=A0A9E5MN11_9GAMM|nr:BCD family MFS transporter [Aestuariicella hydrocarbonica]NHO67258.1 BCD family MFS transporter [Aestuariicella hydrocarbonica]